MMGEGPTNFSGNLIGVGSAVCTFFMTSFWVVNCFVEVLGGCCALAFHDRLPEVKESELAVVCGHLVHSWHWFSDFSGLGNINL